MMKYFILVITVMTCIALQTGECCRNSPQNTQTSSESQKFPVTVTGKIKIPGTLPDSASVEVRLLDTSLADAAAKELASVLLQNVGRDLRRSGDAHEVEYSISAAIPNNIPPVITIEARCVDDCSGLVTDTAFEVNIQRGRASYERDFYVIRYDTE